MRNHDISLYYFYHCFRNHKETMIKLRKVLTDSAKARRHRRNVVNLQITFLQWLIEVFGFLIIFLGTFILGHENNLVNFSMHLVTLVVYFNILPCIFLINDSHVKGQIIESNWYNRFLNIFNCQYTNPTDEEDTTENVGNEMHEENPIQNSNRPINIDGGRNESIIEVEKQEGSEIESNKTKNGDNNGQISEITNDKFEKQQYRIFAVSNQPLPVTNDVVLIDLET